MAEDTSILMKGMKRSGIVLGIQLMGSSESERLADHLEPLVSMLQIEECYQHTCGG